MKVWPGLYKKFYFRYGKHIQCQQKLSILRRGFGPEPDTCIAGKMIVNSTNYVCQCASNLIFSYPPLPFS